MPVKGKKAAIGIAPAAIKKVESKVQARARGAGQKQKPTPMCPCGERTTRVLNGATGTLRWYCEHCFQWLS